MPMTFPITMSCDHPGCTHSHVLLAQVASDGSIIRYEEAPKGWRFGGDSARGTRQMIVFCDIHSEETDLQLAMQSVVSKYKGRDLTIDDLARMKSEIIESLDVLVKHGKIPPVQQTDIKVESDGTVSLAINDARGAVRPQRDKGGFDHGVS